MTRRNALGTAMVLATPALASIQAALASPAVAGADPILAAIEAHRAALASYQAAIRENSRLETELPRDRREWACTVWDRDPPADCPDDPRWIASELETLRSNDAIDEMTARMASVKPATRTGCAALLSYVAEMYGVDDGEWQFPEKLVDDDGTERPFVYFILKMAAAAIGGVA